MAVVLRHRGVILSRPASKAEVVNDEPKPFGGSFGHPLAKVLGERW